MSTTPDDGGPAYPVSTGNAREGHQDGNGTWQFPGLSQRAHFATAAMQAFLTGHITHHGHEQNWSYDHMASEAVDVADAMLAALRKPASPAAAPAQAYAPLTIHELRDLTAMVDGAPWPDHLLAPLQRTISTYNALRANGERPRDPAIPC